VPGGIAALQVEVCPDPRAERSRRMTAARPRSVAAEEHTHSDRFRREQPTLWLLSLVLPFAVTGLVLGAIGVLAGWEFLWKLAVKAMITFFGAGRFIILAGGDAGNDAALSSMTRGQLFAMVTYMDLLVASLLVVHAGFIFRIPRFGPALAALQEDGEFILRMHPWMRRMAFLGLALFVMFPLAATGSVGGAIFGRLLGMSRVATFAAIFIGSVVGNGIMWLFAGVLSNYLNKDHPGLLIGGIAVIVVLILFMNWRYRVMKRRDRERGLLLPSDTHHPR
jgi:uncharacterized membrane protein